MLALSVLVYGCGGRATDAERAPSLAVEALNDIGEPLASSFYRFNERKWLRDGFTALRSRDSTVRRVSIDEALNSCLSRDVILVADDHLTSEIRHAVRKLLVEIRRRHTGPLALALEFLPSNLEEDLHLLLEAEDRDGVLDLFRRYAVWPVAAYVPLVFQAQALGVELIGAGMPVEPGEFEDFVPPAATEDDLRRQRQDAPRRPGVPARDGAAANQHACYVIGRWIACSASDSENSPRVVTLFGSSHLTGTDQSIQSCLAQHDLRSALLAVVSLPLEHEIRRRWPHIRDDEWVQLRPGVYRAGLVSGEGWVSLARTRAAQFEALLRQIPMDPKSHGEFEIVMNSVARLASCSPRRARPVLEALKRHPRMKGWEEFFEGWVVSPAGEN